MHKLLTILISFFVISCNSDVTQNTVERANSKDTTEMISEVSADNIEMNNARSKAKASYEEFFNTFKNGCDSCSGFEVKMRFSDGDGNVEHMWLDELKVTENKVTGILVGTPEKVLRLHTGDKIMVNKDSLSDWMYIRNGKMIGGYTIRYFYNKMSKAEQLKLEDDLGAEID